MAVENDGLGGPHRTAQRARNLWIRSGVLHRESASAVLSGIHGEAGRRRSSVRRVARAVVVASRGGSEDGRV